MVDVEQVLGTLEQDLLAGLEAFPEEQRGVGDVGLEAFGVPGVFLDDHFWVHGQRVVDPRQDLVLLHEGSLHLLRKILGSNRSWTRMPKRAYLSV